MLPFQATVLCCDTLPSLLTVSPRTEDIVAEDISRRARLFCEPGKPLDQTPFLRVISSGDAAVQQIASVSLALLIVVRMLYIYSRAVDDSCRYVVRCYQHMGRKLPFPPW